ncbi:hypothetical protein HMPREF1583_01385 [Gardnerella vaginalis JCP8151B]|nr:hypothetical protein HMPREF1583_01385 [Gardnerella vaginalis JCP8151B]
MTKNGTKSGKQLRIFDLKHVQTREKPSALCTIFGLNHIQKAEKTSALCTKFDLNYVQNAEKVDACGEFISALQRVKSVSCLILYVSCLIYKCLDN